MLQGLKIEKIARETELARVISLKAEQSREQGREFDAGFNMFYLGLLWKLKEDFWVANFLDSSVGYIRGGARYDVYKIDYVFVLKNFRRRGVGFTLGESAIKRARELGCNIVNTDILIGNNESLALHRRLGFSFSESDDYILAELKLN